MEKKFLIIICSNVGDAICATPAIQLLHDHCPNAQIDVLALSTPSAQVVQHNPCVSHIIRGESITDLKQFAACYTEVLVFMGTAKENILAEKMERPYWRGDIPNPAHLRDVGIHLIQKMFPDKNLPVSEGNFLYPQPNDFMSIEAKLKKAGATLTGDEVLIGCHVGCSKAAKRALQFWKRKIASYRTWPFENYYQLTQNFQKTHPHIKWVMTGTQGEQKIINKYFKKKENLLDLTSQTSILELAALMKYCRVFLSGDTGPMHVAGCTDVPMVSLFSATHPDVTGPKPLRKNRIFLRDDESIKNISIDAVEKAIRRLLPEFT